MASRRSRSPGPSTAAASGSPSHEPDDADQASTSTGMRIIKRRVGERGRTKAHYLSRLTTKLPIEWRDRGIVGDNHKDAATWIRQIVQNEALAPIVGVKGFKEIDPGFKDLMYKTFLEKFEWDNMGVVNHRDDVLELMKVRYKGYRGELHDKFGYLVDASADALEGMTNTEFNVLSIWLMLGLSARNKQNKASNITPASLMGRISMPQRAYEMERMKQLVAEGVRVLTQQ